MTEDHAAGRVQLVDGEPPAWAVEPVRDNARKRSRRPRKRPDAKPPQADDAQGGREIDEA